MGRIKSLAWRAGWQVLLCVLLTACSGGGDGGGSAPPTPLPDALGVSVPKAAEAGLAVDLTTSAVVVGELRFEWSFGDGSVGQGASARHVYAAAGDFEVVLRVTNGAGQFREARSPISVSRTARLQSLACTGANGQGWCELSSRPTGNRLNALHFVDPRNGWAVGDNGEIQHTADGGATWQAQSSGGVGIPLNLVVFKNATEGWVGRQRPLAGKTLLRTVDGGLRWSLVTLPQLSSDAMSFSLLGNGVPRADIGFCTPISGCSWTAYVSNDGGVNWIQGGTSREGGFASYLRTYQVVAPAGTVWSLSGPNNAGDVMKSVDNGLTSATVLQRPGVGRLLVFDDRSVLHVGGAQGDFSDPVTVSGSSFSLTRDGGATWQVLAPSGLPADARFGNWLAVTSPDGQVLLGVGDDLYLSRDYGANWALAARKPSIAPHAVGTEGLGGSPSGLLGYSDYSSIASWRSLDTGRTWTRQGTPDTSAGIGSVNWVGGNILFGMGYEGQIFKSTDLGASWTEIRAAGQTAPTTSIALQQWVAVTPERLLRFDMAGFRVSTDFGQTWTTLPEQPWRYSLRDMAFTSPMKGWLVGDFGLYGTTDGGASWQLRNQTDAVDFWAVHFIDDQRGWALNWQGLVVSSSDGGQTWSASAGASAVPPGCEQPRLRFLSPSDGALMCRRAFYVSRDGGKSWSARSLGLSNTTDMVALARADARTLVVLTGLYDGRTMMRSTDAGDTGSPVTSIAGGWNDLQFRQQLGWAVGAGGSVAMTRDGGATWSRLTSSTRSNLVKVEFVDDRTGWMVSEAGLVFTTGTAGN